MGITYGIFLIMGHAGFCPSTVRLATLLYPLVLGLGLLVVLLFWIRRQGAFTLAKIHIRPSLAKGGVFSYLGSYGYDCIRVHFSRSSSPETL